jgi:putative ABC transport system substrate-binding protein
MRRREFIAGLGSAAAWPVAARAQQRDRLRRIGVLIGGGDENDPIWKLVISAFTQALAGLGWTDGRNVRTDLRWDGGDINRTRAFAQELVGLQPDVIVMAALKEVAPAIVRVALMVNPDTAVLRGAFYLTAFSNAAVALAIESTVVNVHSASDIETATAAIARQPGGALIVAPETFTTANRELIVALAAHHQLPAIYGLRQFPLSGGLMSYGPDIVDLARRAASYVERILRGEKPADLPVQAPTKYETVINLKIAKALGLTIPETLLATADEVIQ